jgi:SAM-dependent methyltransferase
MESNVRNLLYRHPELYELAYPEPDDQTPAMCRLLFSRYLAAPPRSILDVGCGTARDLDSLSRGCPECWGVDYLPEMVEYARSRRPHLRLAVGDMRDVRLGRTFDAVLCMGSALTYALTGEDVARALDTLAAHAHPGTLLVLDINNAASYLGGGSFLPASEFEVRAPGSNARARAAYSFDRRRQLLVRRRTWDVDGAGEVEDYCEYRLFFPAELEHLLDERGYRVVGMFDNMQLRETDLSGPRLYVASLLEPDAG